MTAMSPWKIAENRTSTVRRSTCVRECTVRLHLVTMLDDQTGVLLYRSKHFNINAFTRRCQLFCISRERGDIKEAMCEWNQRRLWRFGGKLLAIFKIWLLDPWTYVNGLPPKNNTESLSHIGGYFNNYITDILHISVRMTY